MNTTNQLIRIKDVAKLTTLSKSTIWAKVANKDFPAPIKLTRNISVWRTCDIDAWINACEVSRVYPPHHQANASKCNKGE